MTNEIVCTIFGTIPCISGWKLEWWSLIQAPNPIHRQLEINFYSFVVSGFLSSKDTVEFTTHVTLIKTKIWLRRIYNSYKSPINFLQYFSYFPTKGNFFLILVYQLCLVSIPRWQKQQGRCRGLNHGHLKVSQKNIIFLLMLVIYCVKRVSFQTLFLISSLHKHLSLNVLLVRAK